jgi:tetratricopeptide (TPR) repeat protein
VRAHPTAAAPRLALARYHLAEGHAQKALGLVQGIDAEQANLPEVLAVTSTIQLSQRDYSAAQITLKRLIEQEPEVAVHHYQLAMAFAGAGDRQGMQSELERTVDIEPDHLQALVALARLHQASGDPERFKHYVTTLKRVDPGNLDVLLLSARLANTEGQTGEALVLLEQAYGTNPSQITVLALAQQRTRNDDLAGAISLLEDWVAQHPDDAVSNRALAQLLRATGS